MWASPEGEKLIVAPLFDTQQLSVNLFCTALSLGLFKQIQLTAPANTNNKTGANRRAILHPFITSNAGSRIYSKARHRCSQRQCRTKELLSLQSFHSSRLIYQSNLNSFTIIISLPSMFSMGMGSSPLLPNSITQSPTAAIPTAISVSLILLLFF